LFISRAMAASTFLTSKLSINLFIYESGPNDKKIEDFFVDANSDTYNAMSMQAQAEREKNARVIFGESEIQVAARFVEAAKIYANNPVRELLEMIMALKNSFYQIRIMSQA
jgi:hypothetical protein